MTGTSIPDVKLALYNRIRARFADAGIRATVEYGFREDAPTPCVALGAAISTDGATGPAAFRGGRPRIDEEYRLELFVSVQDLPTPERNEARAAELGAVVEQAVYDPEVQGLDAVTGAWVAGRDLDTYPTGASNNLTRLKITVLVKARTL